MKFCRILGLLVSLAENLDEGIAAFLLVPANIDEFLLLCIRAILDIEHLSTHAEAVAHGPWDRHVLIS